MKFLYKKFNSVKTLGDCLVEHDININNWGAGSVKTIENLFDEIKKRESFLKIENGKLVRDVKAVEVNVYYINSTNKKFRLKEYRQIFSDGRERKRDYLGVAVCEKIKPKESPEQAVVRGMEEELGINGNFNVKNLGISERTVDSKSYPGLLSYYTIHRFSARLNDKQFKADGYVERQKDKNTYFVWEKIK